MNRILARCLAGALATLVIVAPTPARASERWRIPVEAPVIRAFDLGPDPFERGQHRGVDFGAPAGAEVRAACGGRVLVAGRVGTSGRVVTIRCGLWRATHMPLATVTVHMGATIRRGTKIGTVAPSTDHFGLHLGARRDESRFGYIDPLRLIGREPWTPPLTATRPVSVPRRTTPQPAPAPARSRARAPRSALPRIAAAHAAHASPARTTAAEHAPRPSPARRTAPTHAPHAPPRGIPVPADNESSPLAPWPAWAGMAVLLAGAVGTGFRLHARTRSAPVQAAAQEAP